MNMNMNVNMNMNMNMNIIRMILSDLLSPAYIILSFIAILSRYNNNLKLLSSHGKTTTTISPSSSSWFSLPSRRWFWISKRYFVHFYVTGLISTAIACYHFHENNFDDDFYQQQQQQQQQNNNNNNDDNNNNNKKEVADIIRMIVIFLLIIHLLRRLYECLFIQQHHEESSRMNIAGYALGVGYYLVLPLVFLDMDLYYNYNYDNYIAVETSTFSINSTVVIGSGADDGSNNDFTSINGTLSSSYSSSTTPISYVMICFIVGLVVIVNLWLQYEQYQHHVILANIRRRRQQQQQQLVDTGITKRKEKRDDNSNNQQQRRTRTHYSFPPYQRWFRYVLCPHYLAEILLYLTFAIILELTILYRNQNQQHETNDHADYYYYYNLFYQQQLSSKNYNNNTTSHILSCILLGRRYRHWTLFLWVTINLTVSALNSYDWYHHSASTSSLKGDDNDNDNYCHKKNDNYSTNPSNNNHHHHHQNRSQNLGKEKTVSTTTTTIRTVRDKRSALFPKIFW